MKRKELTFLTSVLVPNFFLPARTHADVGVAAQRAFLHIAVAHAGVKDDLFQPREVFVGLFGRRNVRLADNFNQRHAAAVQINRCGLGASSKTFVQALARVFFEVNAGDADLLWAR